MSWKGVEEEEEEREKNGGKFDDRRRRRRKSTECGSVGNKIVAEVRLATELKRLWTKNETNKQKNSVFIACM